MRAGTMELLVVLIVVLVIFGPKQLPKLAKMFGKTTKAFKDGMDNEDEDASSDKNEAKAAPVEEKAEEKKTEDKAE
ncbi:MAG: twin-arginine translocase TatA/TatE family subunit [Faecalibacterium sp.]|jgi:sec-independent protein translocase protein TatA|nr:twin-arginine translocase TatA/TatE family subunit [Faecalibacterium sp.]